MLISIIFKGCSGTRGEVYIADTKNNVVREVATNGTITTFAGGNFFSDLGDGGLTIDT